MARMPAFVVPEIRRTSEVAFHKDVAPGFRFLAIDRSLCSESQVYVAVRSVRNCPYGQQEYVDWHKHASDSLYLFLGEKEDLRGLHAVVRVGSQERNVESPMTVFIPAGVPHCYKLTGGSGTYLSVLLSGDYNASTTSAEPPPERKRN